MVHFPKSDLWWWDWQGWCAIFVGLYSRKKQTKKTCFLSKVLNCFVSIHWSFIVWDIENKVAVMPIYQVTYTLQAYTCFWNQQSSYISATLKREMRIEPFAYIIPYQKDILHSTYTCRPIHAFEINKATILVQYWKERQGSNHSHIIPYQKDLRWSPVMLVYCIV